MADLGTIEQVDLREVWPHEAQDFTPWLADNLDKLGQALGLDLELRSSEAAVGPFSLDVLAHDLGSNRPVIIENQLGTTNHDHLGKLLTYAAGYDAFAVVWLTRDFRDEHRQALDWLNQRTGEDTAFFGVVVEAWRIDGSRPAPRFSLAAMPNDWQKRAMVNDRDPVFVNQTERGERYRLFLKGLIDVLREDHRFTNARNPGVRNSWDFGSGFRRNYYSVQLSPPDTARVFLYINDGSSIQNELLFGRLLERRASIESDLGEPLEWDRLENRKGCRIATKRTGSIDDDAEDLEVLQGWMVDRLLAFKRVFTPHLQELVE